MNKPVIICIDDESTVLESFKIEIRKAIGNECIIETAEGGEEALDLLAELQEEKYEVVVLSDTNLEEAVAVAVAIRQEVKQLKIVNAQSEISKYVTISLGISSWVPTAQLSPELMIKEADTALYEAKHLGRDRVIFKTFAPSLNRINAKL